jgi:signal transduction histidine kinase
MMRRPWAVFLFVPLGWAIILSALAIHASFSVLMLGAVLQGFIFLPFSWAIVTLALVVLLAAATIVLQPMRQGLSPTVARLVSLLAMGTMVGTVMLYIHRANRDSAIRSRLLRQLEEAQRDLAARAHEAGAQEERQRLARDIHDTLAQGFTGVIVQLEAAEDADQRGLVAEAGEHLRRARDMARESLREARRSVHALRPEALEENDLCEALDAMFTKMTAGAALRSEFSFQGDPCRLPGPWEEDLLHIGQEALTNVLRHAGATNFEARITFEREQTRLDFRDDGRGFDPARKRDGFGLVGMRQRVERMGGTLEIRSAPGEGSAICVTVPLSVRP